MPKALEKVPETLAELQAALPELYSQAVDLGKASIDAKALTEQAVTAERDRIVGLVTAASSPELGEKLRAAITSGVTAEGLKALGVTLAPDASGDTAVLKAEIVSLKAANLDLLKKTGSTEVGTDTGKIMGSKPEFFTLVAAYRKEHNCNRAEAIKAVVHNNPEAHDAYVASLKPAKED
jgi:hypothetical protein